MEERKTNRNKGKKYICVTQYHYDYSYTYSTKVFNNFCAIAPFESLVKPTDPFLEKDVFTSIK
jgi:hypothetical protein